VGGHEIRPNHMKVKATRFRQDAECGGSNPAAPARQSLFFRQTTRSRRHRPVSRCQTVKANFPRAALVASRPVAPRIAFCDQEGPAIALRYLTAAIASGAAV
jgi:hypothetical protein